MPEKTDLDVEVEDRVRAHVRREMRDRKIGVNAMERILGVNPGYLSRVLSLERGFGPGFVKLVHLKLGIHGNALLDDDPPKPFFQPDAWDWTKPLPSEALPSARTAERKASGRP